ncbi:hypothetical protein ACP70R_039038 [Stipagrostis hirtigluma subsp. patula]
MHDEKEGHLIFDLLLHDSDEGEETLLSCFPHPAERVPPSWMCCQLAVSGGIILGVRYDFWDGTLFHDTVMKVGGYSYWEMQRDPLRDAEGRIRWWWPMGRNFHATPGGHKEAPAMLPVAGGTVVRMDTILFDGAYDFDPPIGILMEPDMEFVSAYVAVCTRMWISVTHKGTFSVDVGEHGGVWAMEGSWQLPFEGRALHVPELGSVIGLTAGTRILCACDVRAGAPPAMRHVWRETLPSPWEECVDGSRPSDMASLAYLGKGRFCICRPMSTKEPDPCANPPVGSFLVVELRRLPTGELQLAKRGKMTYMWPPPGRQCPYLGFIQPAA